MTPEQFKALFDANGILIVFGWGLLVKYLPWLAKIPNQLIGWTGAIIYVLTQLVMPSAVNAQTAFDSSVLPGVVGILIGAFTSASWARGLYEGFGRPIMEKIFPRKATVPEESRTISNRKPRA